MPETWKFLSERYVPYLELLEHCGISPAVYGPVLRKALRGLFATLLDMEPKEIRQQCREHKVDKEIVQNLQFAVKIMHALSHGYKCCKEAKDKAVKLETSRLKSLYERLALGAQASQLSEGVDGKSEAALQNIMKFFKLVFLGQSGESE